jgi:predicted Zn-dependent protease
MKIDIEKIEKYLEGKLQGEQKEFEAMLNKDEDLRQLISLNREVDAAIAQTEVMALRTQLEEIAAKYHKQKPAVRKIFPNKLTWIATAAAIAAFAVSFLIFQGNNSNQQIFDNYYTSFQSFETVRGLPASSSAYNDGITYFKQNEYNKAIRSFENILLLEPDNNLVRLYSAMAYLETDNPNNAIEHLNIIIESQDVFYFEHAQWYLGLAYIKSNKKSEAKKILKNIVDNDSYHAGQAKKLLKEL